jgi:hypothetical protein
MRYMDAAITAGVKITSVSEWCRQNEVNRRTFYRHRQRIEAEGSWQPRSPTQPMPYVMSDRGDIVAILWADHDPLHAPPLPNVSNKILWVSRVNQGTFTPLRIRAILDGTNQTVTRQVADGPGPSIIDFPAAGC